MFSDEDISRYYDLSEPHYRRIWKLDKSWSLHYGYWDETTKNFHEALLRINDKLAEVAKIRPGEKVLDAGCGIGGSSVWLAKERNCEVVGVSLNQRQIERANIFAKHAGVEGSVVFEKRDYNQTGFDNGSFDIVWGMESICYADDKTKFLREAYRLLKPGGRLIIADFFIREDLKGKDAEQAKRFANNWAINSFATRTEFEEGLIAAGFANAEFIDITPNILPSAKKLYRYWFLGIIGAKLYSLLHPSATSIGKNNVHNARLQYTTLKKGLWRYFIVKAERQ
jgi:tocopherol O-methyltransferase